MDLLEFVEKSIVIHNNKYNYDLVDYINWKTKVKIICPIHGEFLQTPNNHLQGHGCSLCSKNKRLTKDLFIQKAKSKHSDKYDYSMVNYINAHTKVKIICYVHGVFEQEPANHLYFGGCKKCSFTSNKISRENFIKRSNLIHENKYDYSLMRLENLKSRVVIVCPYHGEFKQLASAHLFGKGCKNCSPNNKKTIDETISKLKRIHNDKYKYPNLNFDKNTDKIKIICSKHGEFYQMLNNHLQGHGCPFCDESLGEKKISKILDSYRIKYVRQKTFENCKNKRLLSFDFYLPDYNICIEYDGVQHYESNEYFGGEKSFFNLKERDFIKDDFCKNNNINLLRIKYDENLENSIKNFLKIS